MRKVVVGRDDQRTEGDYENELDKDRGDQCLEVLTSSSVRVWSLVSDLRLNSTLSQSWQRELVRALVNLVYATYTHLTICPYLLIRCYYIIKRKEKKYTYWLRGVWRFMTLFCDAHHALHSETFNRRPLHWAVSSYFGNRLHYVAAIPNYICFRLGSL